MPTDSGGVSHISPSTNSKTETTKTTASASNSQHGSTKSTRLSTSSPTITTSTTSNNNGQPSSSTSTKSNHDSSGSTTSATSNITAATTLTAVPRTASMTTLSDTSYTSPLYMTTTSPGGHDSTILPVIIPSGKSPEVCFGCFGCYDKYPPSLQIDDPKSGFCVQLFGAKIANCPPGGGWLRCRCHYANAWSY
ncbi:hypothetical protein SCAR479_14042 [Seiridium cardinale]|uniref:Uncharacterized protein n=1 Tax=Seiridium cardinale TaxID=138064 RepID=A0ABR2X689_9PEZI